MTSASPIPSFPKALFGAVMVCVCLIATAAAAVLALQLGGDSRTALLAAAAVGIGSVVTFIPILLPTRGPGAGNFGVFVLGASVGRLLLIVPIAFLFTQITSLADRPFWIGVMSGAAMILIVESILAVSLLSKIEKARSGAGAPSAAAR